MGVLPPDLEPVFREIEEGKESCSDHDVSSTIRAFRKQQEKAWSEETMELQAESMAFDFHEDYQNKETGWGTYYGPMMVVEKDGERHELPSISLVTSEILDYWKARSLEAKHPLLRQRYADLVWDFSPKILGQTADIVCAQTMVDASIQLASAGVLKHRFEVRDKLRRALSVALSINDQERICRVANAVMDLEKDIAELDKRGTWGFSFDLLLNNKNVPLTDDQQRGIIDRLEQFLRQATVIHDESGYPVDHFAAQDAALRLSRYYQRQEKREDVRRVLIAYAGAVKAIATKVMAMLGVAWLRQVYDVLVQFSIKDEAESVAVLMHELGTKTPEEMARISHKVEIKQEDFDAYLSGMMTGSEDEVVNRMARIFIPDPNKAERQLKEMASGSVLWGMFSQSLVDGEGREISRVGSVNDDLEGRTILKIRQDMQFEHQFLNPVLNEWIKRFKVTAEGFVDRLMTSLLFQNERRHILLRGIAAYLENDHLTAVHLLVPQVEHAFRRLLVLTNRSVYKHGRHGGMNLKVLDDLLRDPITEQVFGADTVKYFTVLLTDQRGWNLRNDICHGLISVPAGNPTLSDRVIHVLLIQSMIHQQDESSGSDSADDNMSSDVNTLIRWRGCS